MSAQKNSQSTKQKNSAAAARIAAKTIACIGTAFLLAGCSRNPVDSSIGTTDSLSGTADAPTVTYKHICDNVEGDLQTKSSIWNINGFPVQQGSVFPRFSIC